MATCSICAHPHCEAIEAALVAGRSYRDISGQHQVSKSALARHRHHQGSTDREALRHQAQTLQAEADAASNLATMAQVLRKMARLLVQLCERDEYRS